MKNIHKAILCWVGSLSALWVGAWALSFLSIDDWQSFPALMTTAIIGVSLFITGGHFFDKEDKR